jgi:hypothetical protein
MDQFILDNPKAGWREVVREFEKAMTTSMREGELFDKVDKLCFFLPPRAATHVLVAQMKPALTWHRDGAEPVAQTTRKIA